MRKFRDKRQLLRAGVTLAAVLVALAAFYGIGGSAGLGALAAALVLAAGSFAAISWVRRRRRHRGEERARNRGLRDPLTGLPDRSMFMDLAGRALFRAAQGSGPVAVLIVDLDDFEDVNHGLGYEAGDRLLAVAGERLRASVGPEGTVARLSGDEFAVLLENGADRGSAIAVAERVGEALRAPVGLDGGEISISASVGIAIGVAIGGSGGDSPEGLLRNADVAMHEAKRRGKARYRVFDPGADTTTSGRLLIESEMRRAVKEGEFRVYYQPLVALRTGEVRGVEALVRWRHPVYGLVPPGEFIPLAEQTGLITHIGRWVLREACRQVRLWQEAQRKGTRLTLNVNVSACQLRQPNVVEEVLGVLEETGLDPRCLMLEITESALVQDASALDALARLKGSGIGLAMDDFGTGYSNLSYLKRLPVSSLKIDRSYVSGLGGEAEDTAIVHATLAFAEALGLKVTAEGIENAEQLDRLRELGCELGQGYHFAKPLPSDEVAKLFSTDLRRR